MLIHTMHIYTHSYKHTHNVMCTNILIHTHAHIHMFAHPYPEASTTHILYTHPHIHQRRKGRGEERGGK